MDNSAVASLTVKVDDLGKIVNALREQTAERFARLEKRMDRLEERMDRPAEGQQQIVGLLTQLIEREDPGDRA